MIGKPLLSICIPTYNRAVLLDNTLSCITSDDIFKNTHDVQIVISDNCSSDNTEQVCKKYVKEFPSKIKYIRHEKTIFAPLNIQGVLDYADGEFLKMHNDNILFINDGLHKLIDIIRQSDNDVIFCINQANGTCRVKQYDSIDAIVREISYRTTWMCAHCYRTEAYKMVENIGEYMMQWMVSVDVLFKLIENGVAFVCLYESIFQVQTVERKGGQYNVAEVFGKNYIGLLRKCVDKKQLSLPVFNCEKKKLLLKHINPFYFDFKHCYTFQKTGYLKYIYADYWDKPYFYSAYLWVLIKRFSSLFLLITKDLEYREIRLFGLFKIKVKRKKRNRAIEFSIKSKGGEQW